MKIKLTESKLKQIVAESVKKVLKEDDFLRQLLYRCLHEWTAPLK